MLQIFLNKEALNLPSDIQINLIIENPLFVTDRLPVPFSLVFDVPDTEQNLRLTKYPNRVWSFKRQEESADLHFQGIPFLSGLIVVEGFENRRIKMTFKGISVFEALKTKLQEIEMASYNIGDVVYDTSRPTRPGSGPGSNYVQVFNRDNPTDIAYKYRKLYFASIEANNNIFYTGPVKIKDKPWKSIHIRYRPHNSNSIREIDVLLPTNTADDGYLNFYNVALQDFNLSRNYVKRGPIAATLSNWVNTRCFPFPYLKYIINQAFGDLLLNNPFDEAELDKLVLITSYHPAWTSIADYMQDRNLQGMLVDQYFTYATRQEHNIHINKYMPDVQINDLLKNLMRIFCLTGFAEAGKISIRKNKDIFNSTETDNWTNKVTERPILSIREKMTYKFGYEDVEDESVDDLDIIEKTSVNAMLNEQLAESNNMTGYFRITNTGEVFKKSRVDSDDVYERLVSGFGKSEEGDNEFDSVSGVSPLAMGVHKYWYDTTADNSLPAQYSWYVPEMDDQRGARSNKINIMFARGLKQTPEQAANYPFLSSSNVDSAGNKIGNYSLSWEGEDGLINKFHSEFKSFIESDKIMFSQPVVLSVLELRQLDLSKKKHINGKNFFIEKLQITLTANAIKPAIVDFIEA